MGWHTLEGELYRRRPDFVGIGEEAVSCVEGLRLARLAKAGGARVIAGGCFFGQVGPQALGTGLIDVVVHGEGEVTLVELIEALLDNPAAALGRVAGISFLSGPAGETASVVTTPPRALITDLDTLPFPAYDLLPVEHYGAGSVNHPDLAAIELGRGCFGCCDFCVLWRQMGQFVGEQATPRLRVKSAERVCAEIRELAGRYHRRYLGWVDPCFNAEPRVPGEVAEWLLRTGLHLGQSAWVRSDALVRDGHSGALASCVRSGLNEVYLGIERPDGASLTALRKTSGVEAARAALRILHDEFPEVLALGSFIYGLPGDSPSTVRGIHRLAIELGLDQFFFIPLTPLPGTSGWRPELWDPSGERFRGFNFLPAGRSDGRLAVLERALLFSLLFNWPPERVRGWARRLFSSDARKRRVHRRLHARAVRFHLGRLIRRTFGGADDRGLIFPTWYES